MELVFCGTPQFAVPTLEKLVKPGFVVRLVVTQPDRPRGRGMEVAQSPVKRAALDLGLPIMQPETIKNNTVFRERLEEISPQAIVVVGYGRMLPQWMLDLPPLGNINLHASLLPKYRGAAPIQWAIANGETVTGNSTMRINAGLDTGDVIFQEEMIIGTEDTAETVAPQLAGSGAALMVKTLHALQAGTASWHRQDDSKASLAPILKKEDGRIDFARTAVEIYNRLRGFQPWPGASTTFRGKSLKVISAKPSTEKFSALPGEIFFGANTLIVGCGQETLLEILELQLEGKKRMQARDFINGHTLNVNETFGGG